MCLYRRGWLRHLLSKRTNRRKRAGEGILVLRTCYFSFVRWKKKDFGCGQPSTSMCYPHCQRKCLHLLTTITRASSRRCFCQWLACETFTQHEEAPSSMSTSACRWANRVSFYTYVRTCMCTSAVTPSLIIVINWTMRIRIDSSCHTSCAFFASRCTCQSELQEFHTGLS